MATYTSQSPQTSIIFTLALFQYGAPLGAIGSKTSSANPLSTGLANTPYPNARPHPHPTRIPPIYRFQECYVGAEPPRGTNAAIVRNENPGDAEPSASGFFSPESNDCKRHVASSGLVARSGVTAV